MPPQISNLQVRWDYDIRVPNEMGFAAVLPNVDVRHGVMNWPHWSFTLSFHRKHFNYRGSRNVLGFNPKGRLMLAGRTVNNADVYLAWMPIEAMQPGADLYI